LDQINHVCREYTQGQVGVSVLLFVYRLFVVLGCGLHMLIVLFSWLAVDIFLVYSRDVCCPKDETNASSIAYFSVLSK
jgi:hypothetical protein